jgi:DEAD/DEAH box helicase domain-containing protein
LTYSIREIVRNVIEHSESETYTVSAQYWPSQSSAEFAVADAGCGVLSSLSHNPKLEVENDLDALKLAMLPGISSKAWRRKGSQDVWVKCLLDESESLGMETKEPPPGASWPDTFQSVYELAKPGARRPREFDYIAQLGSNSPHFNYPLRQVGEANFKLAEGARDWSEQIGDIALHQAIREAYPGALYLHLRRPMKVKEWRSGSHDRTIRLETARNSAATRPILKKAVNVGLNADDIVGRRLLSGQNGAFAEINVQVNESVVGFTMGGKPFLYRDLRAQDPRMTRKQREFRSTGVILKINEPWFSGGGEPAMVRQAVAEALKQLLLRDKSISPSDIDCAHTHIAFFVDGGPRRATDTIVIYDSIYGGLRLTEPLFNEFAVF